LEVGKNKSCIDSEFSTFAVHVAKLWLATVVSFHTARYIIITSICT